MKTGWRQGERSIALSFVTTMDMSFSDVSPNIPAMLCFIVVAITFLAAAVIVSFRRRRRNLRPGLGVGVLLAFSALALYFAYLAYFPSCPRNLSC